MLNSRGPSTDPWVTPRISSDQLLKLRSIHPEVLCKKGVPENFAKFTRKHLCRDRVSGLRPATLLKKRLCQRCFSYEYCKISKNTFSYRTPPVAATALYIGETKKKVITRTIEPQQDSFHRKWESSGATEQCLECHGQFNWINPKTLSIEQQYHRRKIRESLEIKCN